MSNDEDLFAGMDDNDDDLLASIDEDDSEGWVPSVPGEGLIGTVVKSGTTLNMNNEIVPTVTVKTKDGDRYRVIGYGSVLKRELTDNDPQVGDLLAVKYFGEKTIKKGQWAGKEYKHYGVAVKRGGGTAPAAA